MIHPPTQPSSAAVADHYDELDPIYRQIWGEHVHHGLWESGRETPAQAVEALTDLVASRLALAPGRRLCDIGCGYGASAARLTERHQVQVTGLTLSATQVAIASARPDAERRLTFIQRDWLHNDLPDHSFDGAYAIESSEHMPDKQRFFAEAARTLIPGGRLVVCAWLARERAAKWQVRHLLEPICREGRLPSMGTADEYVGMAERVGFRLIEYRDLTRKVRRTWTICAARLLHRIVTDRAYTRFLTNAGSRNRDFALSLPRLMLAYRLGAMTYGLFVLERN